jgi:hypothetical protein
MICCAVEMNADRAIRFPCRNNICGRDIQNRNRLPSVSSESFMSEEMIMTPFQHRMSHMATAAMAAGSLSATTAFALQDPGGGLGTAGGFTQSAMALIVYVVGRDRRRRPDRRRAPALRLR